MGIFGAKKKLSEGKYAKWQKTPKYSDEEKEPLLQKESSSSLFYFIYDLLWLLILSNVYLVSVYWFSYIIVYWYSISRTFRDYLIFAFFGTSFRSQNIRNTQIIYPLWYYVNLFKWEKNDWHNKKKYRFPYFCKYCDTQKIRIYRIFKFFATKKVIYKSMWWSNG